MFTMMIISSGTRKKLVVKLMSSYRPHAFIESPNGPSDLVHGRWDGIDTKLTEEFMKNGYPVSIELVLVGRVRGKKDQIFSLEEHDALVANETNVLRDARNKVVPMIEHKTSGARVHSVMVIADYIMNEIHKISDLSA